jgi:hypothetical protein
MEERDYNQRRADFNHLQEQLQAKNEKFQE